MMLTWKNAKRLVILIAGSTVVLIGIALIVLPGPAFIVIPLGLAILATEFVWAKQLLDKVKRTASAFPTIMMKNSDSKETTPTTSGSTRNEN